MKLLKNFICLTLTMISLYFHEIIYLINKNFEKEILRDDENEDIEDIPNEYVEPNIQFDKLCENCQFKYQDETITHLCKYKHKEYKCRIQELEDYLGVNGHKYNLPDYELSKLYQEYLRLTIRN